MYTTLIVALIALFVGVIVTAYYYEYKLTKKARQKKAGLPTAITRAYDKGFAAGYKKREDDSTIVDRILNAPQF